MLGSRDMTEAILPFNPKGAFGERHIHALPYRLIPEYDPNNEDHWKISKNGIGRHKAYGYGMLLLRPPGTAVAEN